MSGRSVTHKMYFSDIICEGKGGILYTTYLPSTHRIPLVLSVLMAPEMQFNRPDFELIKGYRLDPPKIGTVVVTVD